MNPEAAPAPSSRTGLLYILAATAIAGALGYLIQAVVPAFTEPSEYIAFSVFWSAVYLAVSAISGIQQEVTRAAHPVGEGRPSGWSTLWRFAVICAVIFIGLALATSPLWAPAALGSLAVALIPAFTLAAFAYTLVAVLSGAYYGLREWRSIAGMTVSDAVLRAVAVMATLAFGGGVVALGWSVAIPFAASLLLMWVLTGRRVRSSISLDASVRVLLVNSASTVGAALAIGVMVSGLPLLLGVLADGVSAATLASLILIANLTRAPLVVPLMALQSYLVVTFRDDADAAARKVRRWAGGLVLVTAVLAVAGAWAGPWLIGLVYGGDYRLEPWVYALVITSAGLTAALCLTGPALLAAGRHRAYVAGWAAASVAQVIGLALPLPGVGGVIAPLVIAPIVGVAVHAGAMRSA